jgi:hypothetical protein
MATELGELTLEEAARTAAGNWRRFKCFCWWRASELLDADQWAIVYTQNRDSELLDLSNAAAIAKVLQPFVEARNPDVVAERHDHWACGWVDGYSIRVFRRGRITRAFRAYHEVAARLANSSVLDEHDYSAREYEATVENLADAAWKLKRAFQLPSGWESQVYEWLSDHNSRAIENRDDRGGYPEQPELESAFVGLGYERVA